MSGILCTSFKIYFSVSCSSERLFHSLLKNRIMPFYAVAKGRTTGIYHSWAECESQVKGYSGAKFKKFDTASAAQEFLMTGNLNSNPGSFKTNISYQANNFHNSANSNLKRSYPATSKSSSCNTKNMYHRNDEDSESSDDGLEVIIAKQMDDIEKRVNNMSKGIDRITKKAPKQTILIEPPQPKKYKPNNDTAFQEDDDGFVQVYTDGACSSNGQRGARAGLGIYWGDNHHLNRSEPVSGRATNNCGEIQAASLAIKMALKNGVNKLAINTDSQFLIKSATQWIPGWKRRGWKLASGEPVKNEADFRELDSVQNKLEIKWNYVKAHDGLHGNEMADKLAKEGAAKYDK
ncbi:hypothetical protein MSG28_000511 [Choristoneura fumiferana]|uniref:Uncharacterized protein n=1 Tax=Choristoneura fumiferana TaxID=7141 RepID=A0ACC0K1F8_CHOFU|nr:hypothetical protein MSG28_000511 [Choristoneura fumiferana]